MFLAINELLKEKLRFLLITCVVILVSYLTFFLTGLAYGLATSYTQGIDSWNAGGIVLQKDANNTIGRSLLTESTYQPLLGTDTALLGASSATIEQDGTDDVTLFGMAMDSFLTPEITEGRAVEQPNEIVVADDLKKIGITLDQELSFQSGDTKYKVVGFTAHATFQTAPIVYMQLDAWRAAASELAGMTAMRDDSTVSAVVTKDSDAAQYTTEETTWQSIRDFSFKLPGYNAQVLTFGLMIGFLIAISSLVLAVFMYVLTLQKKSIFGVLKAEGIPNGYIARSVLYQTVIISAVGLLIGLGLTLLSAALLSGKVPFLVNPIFFAGITGLFLIFAAIGSIASVRSVAKIDPVEAIG